MLYGTVNYGPNGEPTSLAVDARKEFEFTARFKLEDGTAVLHKVTFKGNAEELQIHELTACVEYAMGLPMVEEVTADEDDDFDPFADDAPESKLNVTIEG